MTTSVSSSNKSTIVTVVAIYTAVQALISLCGGLLTLAGGAILGGAGAAINQAALESGDAEAAQAAAALTGMGSGLIAILGIVVLIVAVAQLVDAVGLFQSKPWSWMLTIVLYGISVGLTILQLLAGGRLEIIGIFFLVVNAVIIFLFLTNQDVKNTLGKE